MGNQVPHAYLLYLLYQKILFQLIVSANVSYIGDKLEYGFSYLAFGDWGTYSGK